MVITPIRRGICNVPVHKLLASLKAHFPDSQITMREWSEADRLTAAYTIRIESKTESSFSVTALRPGDGFSIDGLEEQDAKAAVAIREAWLTNRRIIAVENSGAWFVELVPGMTPEDVITGRRPFSELRE